MDARLRWAGVHNKTTSIVYTIITMKMNAESRLATANTRTVALIAKQTAAPAIVVRYNVRKNTKNLATSNWNPSQYHSYMQHLSQDIFSSKR